MLSHDFAIRNIVSCASAAAADYLATVFDPEQSGLFFLTNSSDWHSNNRTKCPAAIKPSDQCKSTTPFGT